MAYVDGFVAAVPVAKKEEYVAFAKSTSALFKEYGAIGGWECWADDVPEGELTSFTMAVKRADDEAAVFSWMVWPSKEVRDKAWAAVMEDPRMAPDQMEMPFDGKRMIYGGFTPIFDLASGEAIES